MRSHWRNTGIIRQEEGRVHGVSALLHWCPYLSHSIPRWCNGYSRACTCESVCVCRCVRALARKRHSEAEFFIESGGLQCPCDPCLPAVSRPGNKSSTGRMRVKQGSEDGGGKIWSSRRCFRSSSFLWITMWRALARRWRRTRRTFVPSHKTHTIGTTLKTCTILFVLLRYELFPSCESRVVTLFKVICKLVKLCWQKAWVNPVVWRTSSCFTSLLSTFRDRLQPSCQF